MKTHKLQRLEWIDDELAALEQQGLRRRVATRSGPQAAKIVLDGQELINFGSNDYLAVASDPRLARAAAEAASQSGWGSGASPLVCGHAALHAALERRIAEFEGCEASLLFTSGFAANVGTLATLVSRQDALFADQKNHASLIDGGRLSRAKIHIYRHADCDHLEELLRVAGGYRRRLIVTDSLFSMDGDLAPLVRLAELADRHDAMLMVDEAHATGVFGRQGRGVAEHLGVEEQVDVRIGTLSKALGGIGGFVAGRRPLVDWLANRARTYVFSTAAPAAVCAAALAALDVVADEPQRRQTLLAQAVSLRNELSREGWQTGDSASQIIPLYVGQADRAMAVAADLRQRGFFVPGIRPPSVPEGQSLLRISLSYGHTEPMIDALAAALRVLAPGQSTR